MAVRVNGRPAEIVYVGRARKRLPFLKIAVVLVRVRVSGLEITEIRGFFLQALQDNYGHYGLSH